MAMFWVVESALPLATVFTKQSVTFAVPWISLTSGLNTIITVLIAGRIIYLSRGIADVLPPEDTRVYTNTVAILVESALPFTLLGIVFAVTLGKGIPESIALSDIWGIFVVRQKRENSLVRPFVKNRFGRHYLHSSLFFELQWEGDGRMPRSPDFRVQSFLVTRITTRCLLSPLQIYRTNPITNFLIQHPKPCGTQTPAPPLI